MVLGFRVASIISPDPNLVDDLQRLRRDSSDDGATSVTNPNTLTNNYCDV